MSVAPYYKAVIALVGTLVTAVATVAASPEIAGVLPSSGAGVVAVVGTALTTALTWLKRNEPTVEQAEKLLSDARSRANFG